MNDRLERLLQDPRAHGDAPDPEAVRAWGEAALSRWQAEQAPAPAAAPRRAGRLRNAVQHLGLVAGLAVAAFAVVPLLAGWFTRLGEADLGAVLPEVSGSGLQASLLAHPLPWAAGVLLVALLAVPQCRDLARRLIDE